MQRSNHQIEGIGQHVALVGKEAVLGDRFLLLQIQIPICEIFRIFVQHCPKSPLDWGEECPLKLEQPVQVVLKVLQARPHYQSQQDR
jgi:hypothetical protein